MTLWRGLLAFLAGFASSDVGAGPEARWLRHVAHVLLGDVAGVAAGAQSALWAPFLALWAAVQAVQWGRDGWSRRGLRDLLEDTGWTAAGLWLGLGVAPRDPGLWGWSIVALATALILRAALLHAPRKNSDA